MSRRGRSSSTGDHRDSGGSRRPPSRSRSRDRNDDRPKRKSHPRDRSYSSPDRSSKGPKLPIPSRPPKVPPSSVVVGAALVKKLKSSSSNILQNLVIGFWNIQGQGSFHSGHLQPFLDSIPTLDVLILAECHTRHQFILKGWTAHPVDVSPTYSVSRRGRAAQEAIIVIIRDGINFGGNVPSSIQIYNNLHRHAVSFTVVKGASRIDVLTFHATYDNNSGTASIYMNHVFQKNADLLIGDANLYGSKRGTSRSLAMEKNKAKREKKKSVYHLMTGDLRTSRGNSPLDKAYASDAARRRVSAYGLLDEIVNASATSSKKRKSVIKDSLKKLSNAPDHRGIFVVISPNNVVSKLGGLGLGGAALANDWHFGHPATRIVAGGNNFTYHHTGGGGNCLFARNRQPDGLQRGGGARTDHP